MFLKNNFGSLYKDYYFLKVHNMSQNFLHRAFDKYKLVLLLNLHNFLYWLLLMFFQIFLLFHFLILLLFFLTPLYNLHIYFLEHILYHLYVILLLCNLNGQISSFVELADKFLIDICMLNLALLKHLIIYYHLKETDLNSMKEHILIVRFYLYVYFFHILLLMYLNKSFLVLLSYQIC